MFLFCYACHDVDVCVLPSIIHLHGCLSNATRMPVCIVVGTAPPLEQLQL